jgi:hypothetical protein
MIYLHIFIGLPAFYSGTAILHLHIKQCLIGAISHAHWNFLPLAKVTSKHLLSSVILPYDTQRANQQACPATNTALFIHLDQQVHRVTSKSTGKAGLNTRSFITLLTTH